MAYYRCGGGLPTGFYSWKRIKRKYLYKSGEEYTTLTGGWGYDDWTPVSGHTKVAPTKNSTNIFLQTTSNNTTSLIGTTNTIDTTGYSRIVCDNYNSYTGTYSTTSVGICSSKSVSNVVKQTGLKNTLDIQGYSGNYYVFCSVGNAGTSATIYSIYLENGEWEYIVDNNENKYPNGEIHTDGYYYELVSGGINPSLWGCTKYAIDTYTPTTTQASYGEISIPHSLGVKPKVALILLDNPLTFNRSGLVYASGIFVSDADNSAAYPTYCFSTLNNGAYVYDSYQTYFSGKTSAIVKLYAYNGNHGVQAGNTYRIITMA